ncbi:hypothetical protein ACIQ9E_18260 [Streptomyces sp. NPDC094448]|uniref:hypothetical protein n=1 Tax=Streptomyces sp. NPDC094448 TaxID=3366063 RepID=UPI00380F54B8
MSDAMIRVPAEVRDRLAVIAVVAVVAESRGLSIRSLVQEFAEETLTEGERRERADRTRDYLAEHFGVRVTEEESAAMGRRLRDAFTGSPEDAA